MSHVPTAGLQFACCVHGQASVCTQRPVMLHGSPCPDPQFSIIMCFGTFSCKPDSAHAGGPQSCIQTNKLSGASVLEHSIAHQLQPSLAGPSVSSLVVITWHVSLEVQLQTNCRPHCWAPFLCVVARGSNPSWPSTSLGSVLAHLYHD